jgi:hypothetical protein
MPRRARVEPLPARVRALRARPRHARPRRRPHRRQGDPGAPALFNPHGETIAYHEDLWPRAILAALVGFLLDLFVWRTRLFDCEVCRSGPCRGGLKRPDARPCPPGGSFKRPPGSCGTLDRDGAGSQGGVAQAALAPKEAAGTPFVPYSQCDQGQRRFQAGYAKRLCRKPATHRTAAPWGPKGALPPMPLLHEANFPRRCRR